MSTKLALLESEPWKIFELDQREFDSYLKIILEIQEALNSNRIQLKDAKKSLQYIETIIASAKEYQIRIKSISDQVRSLQTRENKYILKRIEDLKHKKSVEKSEKDDHENSLKQKSEKISDAKSELESLTRQAERDLAGITNKNYRILV
jgi:hypothetical protein